MDSLPETTTATQTATRVDELGRIILAYSEVTEKLQESHERLEKTVLNLREELGEKNRLLERKNRLAALGEMAAGMAHEIRNPLGGIQLYTSMLARDVEDRPQSLTVVHKIAAGVKHLEGLVSQVLQFTREIAVHPVEMDLADAVGQAIELSGSQRESRGVTCEVAGPSSLTVRADPLMLGQALLNLMLNAIEAMQSGGRLHVMYGPVEDEAERFRVVVQDSGPGIPPAILDRIFNPFFTTKDAGTGLGLAIVHRIVEAHEGTIIATNAVGGGAKFEIRV